MHKYLSTEMCKTEHPSTFTIYKKTLKYGKTAVSNFMSFRWFTVTRLFWKFNVLRATRDRFLRIFRFQTIMYIMFWNYFLKDAKFENPFGGSAFGVGNSQQDGITSCVLCNRSPYCSGSATNKKYKLMWWYDNKMQDFTIIAPN